MPPSFFKNLHCQKKYIQQLPVNSTRKRKPRSYKYLVQVRYQKFLNLIFSSQCLDFSKYRKFYWQCAGLENPEWQLLLTVQLKYSKSAATQKKDRSSYRALCSHFLFYRNYTFIFIMYLFFYYFYYLLCYRNYTYIFILKLNTGRYCNF